MLGLCQGLQQAGVDVQVVTTTANGDTWLQPSPAAGDVYEGVPVVYCAAAFPRRFFGAHIGAALGRALEGADLCHVHGIWNVPEWQATRMARRAGVPYLISPRGMLHPAAVARGAFRKRLAFWLLERRALDLAACLHATAPEEVGILERVVPGGHVALIPNGVALDQVQGSDHMRARLGIGPDAPVFVFLGRIHPQKRIDLAAAAVAAVRERYPSAHFVVAGPDEGGYLQTLRPSLAPLGAHLHITGALGDRDKWALLGGATALVMCSDSESFGLAAVESLAAGRPVIATRTCPWARLESDGCGFWVEQRPEAMAGAMQTLIEQPALAEAMGRRAAAVARADYSWTAVGRAMADCYRDVLERARVAA